MSSASLKFINQQAFLSDQRHELVHSDAQCRPWEQQRRELFRRVLGRSHVASADDLWPLVDIVNRVVPPENQAVIFSLCADGSSLTPVKVQPVPQDLFRALFACGVLAEIVTRAQSNELRAREWHSKHRSFFPRVSVTRGAFLTV